VSSGAEQVQMRNHVSAYVTSATLAWVLERLARGERVALASVIQASGSVPGKPGARLAVSDQRLRHGTVGGAGLELRVEKHLQQMLINGSSGSHVETYVLHRDAKGKEVEALDSLCGGRVTVSLEVLEPVPHVLIAGGGHCGQAIAAVCENLGWTHSVFDVRREFAADELYPNAVENHDGSVETFLQTLAGDALIRFSDILLIGHDWAVDQDLLIGILQRRGGSDRPRIGAIGSKSKWMAFKTSALDAGIEEDAIDSVRCPIGIDIGATSPEEIAVAVCAEILALERGKI